MENKMSINISRRLLNEIHSQGENAYPRYLITAADMLGGEKEAERLGQSIIGIFHSHPDHPNLPSEFDREWAIPWYSYLITRVDNGQAVESKSWRLIDDRSGFSPEDIIISPEEN
jgi:proteasome lid subunit RPN8/RPN11